MVDEMLHVTYVVNNQKGLIYEFKCDRTGGRASRKHRESRWFQKKVMRGLLGVKEGIDSEWEGGVRITQELGQIGPRENFLILSI